jgi:sigma-B regulation protein RsbU (phosphoserine phosphatase)
MFVTIFLGCYNLKSGIFTYANAGHLNAYILKHDGTLDSFGILGDFALGIMTIPSFQTGTRAIEPGDRLILYTDGISEATAPNGELFGDMRFEAFLSSHASMETPELCDAIVDTINPHCAFEVSVTFT